HCFRNGGTDLRIHAWAGASFRVRRHVAVASSDQTRRYVAPRHASAVQTSSLTSAIAGTGKSGDDATKRCSIRQVYPPAQCSTRQSVNAIACWRQSEKRIMKNADIRHDVIQSPGCTINDNRQLCHAHAAGRTSSTITKRTEGAYRAALERLVQGKATH